MNNEDFVTYEQAAKLKELGFDWECTHFYDCFDLDILISSSEIVSNDGGVAYTISVDNLSHNFNLDNGDGFNGASAPTLAQVAKWLREVKDIIIGIDFDNWHDKYECHVYKRMGYSGENIRDTYGSRLVTNEFHEDFDTYEEALSEGINKAIELLK